MDNHIYYINLFDYYGNLLTEKQQEYFVDYYFNNLSHSEIAENYKVILSEISENNNVSRTAINNQLHQVIEKLDYYEDKLELYSKSLKIKEIIKNESEEIKEKIEELI